MPAALKQYLPLFALVVAAVLSGLATALTDNRVDNAELLSLFILGVNALATYVVPRVEGLPWLKPVVSALLVGLQALFSYLTDGVTGQEWVLVALAALGAVGVAATNKQAPLHPRTVVGAFGD